MQHAVQQGETPSSVRLEQAAQCSGITVRLQLEPRRRGRISSQLRQCQLAQCGTRNVAGLSLYEGRVGNQGMHTVGVAMTGAACRDSPPHSARCSGASGYHLHVTAHRGCCTFIACCVGLQCMHTHVWRSAKRDSRADASLWAWHRQTADTHHRTMCSLFEPYERGPVPCTCMRLPSTFSSPQQGYPACFINQELGRVFFYVLLWGIGQGWYTAA